LAEGRGGLGQEYQCCQIHAYQTKPP
jgi:hypothetical protein